MSDYFLLNPPNPPGRNIYRAFAGGFGTLGGASEDDILIPQYLVYAASALKNKGIEYEVLDAQGLNRSGQELLSEIEKSSPDVLIAWMSLPSLVHDLEVLNGIKKALPDTLVMAYGTVCKAIPEEILETSRIDALINGTYPYYTSISNITSSLNEDLHNIPGLIFKENGKIVRTPEPNEKENLDALNLDVYRRLPVKKYTTEFLDRYYRKVSCIPILTGVGCPYDCIYCPYPLGYGSKIISKSNEKILEEIEFLIENYGISGFVFREQAFTFNRNRVLDFCSEVIRRGLEIDWLFETRVDLVDPQLLKRMKEAGCFRIHYGVETGDEKILEKIGKPRMNKEKIKKAFCVTKQAGIFAQAHMMIGFPDENWDTIERSIKLLKDINPDSVNINIVTPYPKTELYDHILQAGLLTSEDWSIYTSYEPVIRTKYLNGEDLKRARKKMKVEFYKSMIKRDPRFGIFFLKKLWNRWTS